MSVRLDPERLARALNDTDHPDCLGWDNPKAGCRGYYRRMATAALAALADDETLVGHGTPVPEEATLPSGDARVAGL